MGGEDLPVWTLIPKVASCHSIIFVLLYFWICVFVNCVFCIYVFAWMGREDLPVWTVSSDSQDGQLSFQTLCTSHPTSCNHILRLQTHIQIQIRVFYTNTTTIFSHPARLLYPQSQHDPLHLKRTQIAFSSALKYFLLVGGGDKWPKSKFQILTTGIVLSDQK